MSAKKYPWSYVVFWLEGTLGHPGVVVLSHLTGGCARGAPGWGKPGLRSSRDDPGYQK